MRTLSEASLCAEPIADPPKRARAFGAIASAHAPAGDADGASRAFREALASTREIEELLHRVRALGSLGAGQAQFGDVEDAARTFTEAQEVAHRIDVEAVPVQTRFARMSAQLGSGRYEAVESSPPSEAHAVAGDIEIEYYLAP